MADGVTSSFALLTPFDVLFDGAGNLIFTDVFFNRVREVLAELPSFEGTPGTVTLTAPAGGQATQQIIRLNSSVET